MRGALRGGTRSAAHDGFVNRHGVPGKSRGACRRLPGTGDAATRVTYESPYRHSAHRHSAAHSYNDSHED